MTHKENFIELVKLIKKNAKDAGAKLRNEDIAERLDITRTYLSDLLSDPGKEVTQKHITLFKKIFKDDLEGVIKGKIDKKKGPVYSLLSTLLDEAAEARADRLKISFEEAKEQIKKKSNLVQDALDTWLYEKE